MRFRRRCARCFGAMKCCGRAGLSVRRAGRRDAMNNHKVYPPRSIWQVMREEALARVGYRCELCGLPDASLSFNEHKPHPFYPQGKPYHLYLQLAHKQQYQSKKGVKRNAPVGLVVLWVWYKGQRCLAAEVRFFDDVFHTVAAFSTGFLFEVEAEMLTCVVGRGRYRRSDTGVEVLRESGACKSFGTLLQEVLQGVC